MRFARAAVLALPGIALGITGLFHPPYLSYTTSHTWWALHVLGVFGFPLVGVALMVLFRGRRDWVAILVVLASFVYACAYTALDVVNGLAAGYVTERLGPGQPRPDEVRYLFEIGKPIGVWGSYALILATLAVALDALWRWRLRALPALLMVPGAYLVHIYHIFAPEGVAGMVLIGLSTAWVAAVASAPDSARRSGRSAV